ncbi:MAG TPA: hypothetical protein EYP10_14050 [Armatimonadetes bacterium]|nr:hypothetical protein [Armatimonadota bacterium]
MGVESVIQELGGYRDRAKDLSPVWRMIARDMMDLERKVFASRGAILGASWAPLSPRYAKWKARHYPGRPIMVRSGRLFASLTREGSPDMILIIKPDALVFGSARRVGRARKWFLAPIHQYPETARVPKRLLMPTKAQELPRGYFDRWISWIGKFITDQLKPPS